MLFDQGYNHLLYLLCKTSSVSPTAGDYIVSWFVHVEDFAVAKCSESIICGWHLDASCILFECLQCKTFDFKIMDLLDPVLIMLWSVMADFCKVTKPTTFCTIMPFLLVCEYSQAQQLLNFGSPCFWYGGLVLCLALM